MDEQNIRKQNLEFLIKEVNNVIDWAFARFKDNIFCTSAFGADGLVLLDLITKKRKDIPIYFIDTGYHFTETLEIKKYYKQQGLNIIGIGSTVNDQQHLLRDMGPDICCRMNKVEPMKRLMKEKKGHLWVAALSRDQSQTRRTVRFLELQENNITKLCPMLSWKEDEVWQYIREHNLKYNRLFDQGYKSIGCQPCTTPVKPDEDNRAGRWRGIDKNECGLHF